jgi:hypothetical protein
MAKRSSKKKLTKKRSTKKTPASRKQTTRKTAGKKTGKKTTKKTAAAKARSASKKRTPRHATKKRTTKKKTAGARAQRPTKPKPVKTGRGPSAAEVGRSFVEMLRTGQGDDAIWKKWMHKDCVSIEGAGVELAFHGIPAIRAKAAEWEKNHVIHDVQIDGPYLGSTGFSVVYTLDITDTTTNVRTEMKEVAVYTVKNGKIVQEEFMYAA